MSRNHSKKITIRSKGLTLVEVLIATTLTLLIMLALTQGFRTLSNSVSEGRSRLAMSDQLRGIILLLNEDLSLRTTDGKTPQDILSASGYFKYVDGGLSDWTTLLANVPSAATIAALGADLKKEAMLNGGSRWGDIDDILQFTARAKPGEAFRGKIPRALMMIANYNEYEKQNAQRISLGQTPFVNAPPPLPVAADWTSDLTISSEFAEIVWFTIPVAQLPDGSYTPTTINAPVSASGETVVGADGMPRRLALCRRILLIRPDLDITPPQNFRVYESTAARRRLFMQPESPAHVGGGPTAGLIPAFEMLGANAYKRCDLSCSTHLVLGRDGQSTYLAYKTNSLVDLQNPQNRFAHGVYPIVDSSGNLVGSTLPLMMLTSGFPTTLPGCNVARQLAGAGVETFVPNGGLIPPDFMRMRYRINAAGDPIESATMQEIVTMDAVAFDIKAFDATAPVLFHPGPDGAWGVANFDDNWNGNIDENLEASWNTSDDVSVSPGDPGFWTLLANGLIEESGRGAFVDVGWGFKGLGLPIMTAINPKPIGIAANVVGEYSGVSVFPNTATLSTSRNLGHSGGLSMPSLYGHSMGSTQGGGQLFVYQNAFDTSTTLYESDGEQDGRGPFGTSQFFRIYTPGIRRLGYDLPIPPFPLNVDPETDVTPPYTTELKSIQATVRLQDVGAQTLQQLSLIHSLSR